jgi:hypothetical protein
MTQQITDPDALAILQSTQDAPAAASSATAITDPDALAVLHSTLTDAKPSASEVPTGGALPRMMAINGAMGFDPAGIVTRGADVLGNYIDAHASPDSLIRKGADAVLGNAISAPVAMMHHGQNAALGLAQMALHNAASMGDSIYGAPNNGLNRTGVAGLLDGARNGLDQSIKDREQTYQRGIPNNLGSGFGAAVGEIAPFFAGGSASLGSKLGEGADAITSFANKIPLLQKTLSGALQGGAIAGLNPVTDTNDSFAKQKAAQIGFGTLAGGALPALASGANGAYGVVKPLVNPTGVARDFLGRILGNDAPQVAQNLRQAPSLVPGSMPTSAQVGQSIPLVQAEKAFANQSPDFKSAMMARSQANNQARLDAIQGVAGTPETLRAAKDARRAAIDPFTSQYLTDSKPAIRWQGAQDAFQSPLNKPGRMSSSDFDALSQANKVASQVRSGAMQEDDALAALKELGDSVTSQKAQNAFQSATDAINRNMVDPSGVLRTLKTLRYGPLGVNPQRATTLDSLISSVQGSQNVNGLVGTDMLDQVRQETGKLARKATGQNGTAYGSANDSLVQAIDRVAPGYADYLGTYARSSQPVTDQLGASSILDRLNPVGLNADQRPVVTLSRYNSALNQANKGAYPLSPQAQDALGNVRRDLQRESVSNSVRSPGSDTAYNLSAPGWLSSKFYGKNFNGGGPISKLVGAGLGSIVPGIGTVGGYLGAEKLANVANTRVFNAAQRLMLNPQAMADELDKLAVKNPALAKALGRLTQQQAAYAAPQITNQRP